MDILKISAKSSPNSVAGAIAGQIKENRKVELQAIGAGALNQAIKAINPIYNNIYTRKQIILYNI